MASGRSENAARIRKSRGSRGCRGSLIDQLEPRRFLSAGATVPYTTLEAESGSYTGTLLGPTYAQNTVAGESSGREAVQLSATGHYIDLQAPSDANSIVVRYSIPDTAGGGGSDSTLGLYINGVLAKRLPVTSKYSWLYGTYPFTNTPSSGSPRNFYDEVRVSGLTIPAGSTVRLQRDAVDTAAYYNIDLIDLENVGAPIAQPTGNWLSLKTYNAAGDGITDDTNAVRLAVSAAIAQGKGLYIPTGTYKLTGYIQNLHDVTIQGAGMWYTTFVGDASVYGTASKRVGFMGSGNNVHLNDFAITGNLQYRNDGEANDGIGGSFGTGSSISDLWIEHTKVGMWVVNSNGLSVSGCRMRDTIADGINFVVGMTNSIASNCTARGTGDDCFAMWPATYISQNYTPGHNTFSHDTGELPFLANGGAIYGGASNTIDQCLFRYINYGSGILISGTFDVGGNVFSGTTTISNDDLFSTGGGMYLASVQFAMNNHPIPGITMSGLNILSSPYSGIGVNNGQTLTTTANNINISTAGLAGAGYYGIFAQDNTVGSLAIDHASVADYNDASPNFKLTTTAASLSSTLPSPWVSGDIGNVGVNGSATSSSGTFVIKGAGADITGTADAFQFVSQSAIGDLTASVAVQSLQNSNAAAKAGLMMRNDHSTTSPYAGVFVTPGDGIVFQYRATAGGATTTVSTVPAIAAPIQLRLHRSGNVVFAYYSADGVKWLQIGAGTTITLSTVVSVGMAVTAHGTSSVTTAQFAGYIETRGRSLPFDSLGSIGTIVARRDKLGLPSIPSLSRSLLDN